MPPANVQPDAQLTIAHILRPFEGFEDVYQDQTANIPIMFNPTDIRGNIETVDFQSGDTNFDDQLAAFIKVPMGSQILVWIPWAVSWDANGALIDTEQYRYLFYWRMRNLQMMQAAVRGPGELKPHHMKTLLGRPDRTAAAGAQARYALPVATRSVVVAQPDAGGNLAQDQDLREERIDILADETRKALPLLPNGTDAHLQQGILDPNEFAGALIPETAWYPLYRPFWFICEGDELAIAAIRQNAYAPGGNWDFGAGGQDIPFSSVYGDNRGGTTVERSPALGIYVFTGNAS